MAHLDHRVRVDPQLSVQMAHLDHGVRVDRQLSVQMAHLDHPVPTTVDHHTLASVLCR